MDSPFRAEPRFLEGRLEPLDLGGTIIEVDTTSPHSQDYARLLQRIQARL